MKAVKTAPILLFSAVLEEGEDFEAAGPPRPTASFTCEGERPERASSFFAEQSHDRRATEQGAPGATERHPPSSAHGEVVAVGKEGAWRPGVGPPFCPGPGGGGGGWRHRHHVDPTPIFSPSPRFHLPLPSLCCSPSGSSYAGSGSGDDSRSSAQRGAGRQGYPCRLPEAGGGEIKTTPKPKNRRERIRKSRRRPGMRSAGWQQGRWVRAPPGGAH